MLVLNFYTPIYRLIYRQLLQNKYFKEVNRMSLVEKKYVVKGQHGDIYSLTAKQLYEQISNNSKLDYNLIASASKLLKICKKPSFPAEYELAIKCTI